MGEVEQAPMLHPIPGKTGLVFRACVLLIAVVWLWAGLWKYAKWEDFTTTVDAHAVLPKDIRAFIGVVPAVEIVLGVGLAGFASRFSRPNSACRWIALSALALLAATAYLWFVPAQVIEKRGCGCRPRLLQSQTSLGGKSESLAFNATLFGLHAACIIRAGKRSDRAEASPR